MSASNGPEHPPSEEFERAVLTGGSIVRDCDFCGRTHFADSREAGDWNEGELEELRKQSEEKPDKCVAHDYDSIEYGEIAGRIAVLGCPCNSLRRYEDWIWTHRRLIAKYLPTRAEAAKREADLEHALLGGLENVK